MAWVFTDTVPIYKQIVSRIREDILRGKYSPDEQIPPVRVLALGAGVNPNTMQRALGELEDEGLLVSRTTVGRFVTSDEAVLSEARALLQKETVEEILLRAASVGISPTELIQKLTEYRDREENAT